MGMIMQGYFFLIDLLFFSWAGVYCGIVTVGNAA